MGVDDEVRHDALGGERHVLLGVGDTHRTFLAVAGRELVSNLGDPHRPHPHLDEAGAVGASREGHPVDHSAFAVTQARRAVFSGKPLWHATSVVRNRGRLADDDIVATHPRTRGCNAIVVKLIVGAVAQSCCYLAVRALDGFLDNATLLLLLTLVRPEKDGPEDAPVDARLIHHGRIFLVVAGVASDRNDRIDTCGQLSEVQILHCAGGHERLLGIAEHVALRVHPHLIICDVHPHRLLPHGALIRVTRRLVVVREGNDGGAHAQDHCRVNLAVRVRRRIRVVRIKPRRLEVVDGH
mmetsp:Transcript_2181/g.6948  ORF Transcript_2181/g.6948 Transcript_2181/m.6948 type:complete len:296 (-) Transcript_2181:2344-3231(-)